MKLILDIATIFGGVAAIWFLVQQISASRTRGRAESIEDTFSWNRDAELVIPGLAKFVFDWNSVLFNQR